MEFVTSYTYVNGELVPDAPSREGIDPVDFIKPDPELTQRETRAYILRELKNWLCGIRMIHSVEQLITEDVSIDSVKDDVEAGMFPAGRMYMILRRVDPTLAGVWGYKDIGYLCYSICAAHLTGQKFYMVEDIQTLILGFITTDQLPSGRVIESFWNYSPFDPLREAPPLSEVDDEEIEFSDSDSESDSEDEVEAKEPELSAPAVLVLIVLFNLLLFLLAKAATAEF
jgi:hypothetical protein